MSTFCIFVAQVEEKVKPLSDSKENADGIRARMNANEEDTKNHKLDGCGNSIQSLPRIEKTDGVALFDLKVILEFFYFAK